MITAFIIYGFCGTVIAAGVASIAYGLFKSPAHSDRVLIGPDSGESDRLIGSVDGLGSPLELEMKVSETVDPRDDSLFDRSRR